VEINPSSDSFPDDGLENVVEVIITADELVTVDDLMLHACNTPSK